MSTTRRLLEKEFLDAYAHYTDDSLKEKIAADTRALEEWNQQGRRAGLIYINAPLGSATIKEDANPQEELPRLR